jgi:allophanate hydrolase subunit 2
MVFRFPSVSDLSRQPKNVWLFAHAIMMADSPTTGGYPKIGTVVSADLPLLAQCIPNKSKIRFRKTTVAKAQKKYQALMSGLNRVVEAD